MTPKTKALMDAFFPDLAKQQRKEKMKDQNHTGDHRVTEVPLIQVRTLKRKILDQIPRHMDYSKPYHVPFTAKILGYVEATNDLLVALENGHLVRVMSSVHVMNRRVDGLTNEQAHAEIDNLPQLFLT